MGSSWFVRGPNLDSAGDSDSDSRSDAVMTDAVPKSLYYYVAGGVSAALAIAATVVVVAWRIARSRSESNSVEVIAASASKVREFF